MVIVFLLGGLAYQYRFESMLEAVIPIDRTSAEPFEEGEEYNYWPN